MNMKPVTNVDDAISLIAKYQGIAEDFELPISNALLDPVDITMALITDRILEKGWEPDGFVQKDGYRIYRYKRA